jgi:hypothetical protein
MPAPSSNWRRSASRNGRTRYGRDPRRRPVRRRQGYRSHVVYTWVRGKAATFALEGRDGWSRPALGQPTPVDIDFKGKRIRNGAMVWAVGTWPLKGAFYAHLRKEGIAAGKPVNPPGYCHFAWWQDEVYFRQITSEYLATKPSRPRPPGLEGAQRRGKPPARLRGLQFGAGRLSRPVAHDRRPVAHARRRSRLSAGFRLLRARRPAGADARAGRHAGKPQQPSKIAKSASSMRALAG